MSFSGRGFLVDGLLQNPPAASNAVLTPDAGMPAASNHSTAKVGELVAAEFWSELSEQVGGLREILESSSGEDEDTGLETPSPEDAGDGDVPFIFTPYHSGETSNPSPTKETRTLFQRIYHERVDCLYKILHWPTVIQSIESLHSSTIKSPNSQSVAALELSIYFMALCVITDDEASFLGINNRRALLKSYLRATERAISEANFLQCPNMTLLQAFVIYLFGHRTCNSTAISWTLLAIAIRVAMALRLGQEDPQDFSPFQLQMRRRLWCCIAIQDIYYSLDRGTPPMVRWEDIGPSPLALKDDEFSPSFVPTSSPASYGHSEVTFFIMAIEATKCNKRMMGIPCKTESGWLKRQEAAQEFKQYMERICADIGEDAPPLAKFTKYASVSIAVGMQMVLRRPPYKLGLGDFQPVDDVDILEIATKLLQGEVQIKSPEFAPWKWKSWPPWHALAVVLAELCSRPWVDDFDGVYAVAVKTFNICAGNIADSSSGKLWKPIARLMRRVQRRRESFLSTPSSGPLPQSIDNCVKKIGTMQATFPPPSDGVPVIDWPTELNIEDFLTIEQSQTTTEYEDPQLNWFNFMQEVNFEFSFEDNITWG
ncbi:hypothetical protein H072_9451 [Dactylellina haptotyla CBS 200.50]|uniref:Xylanolytic transcriptional activator regulatory domain-containing protein n=1 Tax=Dactylellina haptotyla (strain CBS 200.50) TaxID=1284197 RepID=S8BP69_DACHA|nr:hypothetical protein H072_9451 [Dactylellina haptotyla CBS 200.50]